MNRATHILKISKNILFYVLVIAVFLVVSAEIILRVIYSFKIGPSIMLYGTRFSQEFVTEEQKESREERREWVQNHHNVMFHDNIQEGYTKYFPNQHRVTHDVDGNPFRVNINNRGFRGEEISENKLPGELRIAALGASSTFGYGNRDDETYPYLLEKMLNDRLDEIDCADIFSVKVINLGIPHLKSEQIYSLFVAEALPLQPDIVLFYEGVNDAARLPFDYPDDPIIWKIERRSVLVKLIRHLLPPEQYSYRGFQNYLEGKVEHFTHYLSRINQVCLEEGIHFFVISQPTRSRFYDTETITTITFEEEIDHLDDIIRKQSIAWNEMVILVHGHLMTAMRKWAEENEVSLIDGIAALNHRRNLLFSWVHLVPEGNLILARAIAESIVENFKCELRLNVSARE